MKIKIQSLFIAVIYYSVSFCIRIWLFVQDTLKYWMDLGVDGFRVDSCPFLFEDDQFRDESLINETLPISYENLFHNYTKDVDKTYDLVKEWAEYVESYSRSQGRSRWVLQVVFFLIAWDS